MAQGIRFANLTVGVMLAGLLGGCAASPGPRSAEQEIRQQRARSEQAAPVVCKDEFGRHYPASACDYDRYGDPVFVRERRSPGPASAPSISLPRVPLGGGGGLLP